MKNNKFICMCGAYTFLCGCRQYHGSEQNIFWYCHLGVPEEPITR